MRLRGRENFLSSCLFSSWLQLDQFKPVARNPIQVSQCVEVSQLLEWSVMPPRVHMRRKLQLGVELGLDSGTPVWVFLVASYLLCQMPALVFLILCLPNNFWHGSLGQWIICFLVETLVACNRSWKHFLMLCQGSSLRRALQFIGQPPSEFFAPLRLLHRVSCQFQKRYFLLNS